MKKILKYGGIGLAVIMVLWIAIETIVMAITGEEPEKETAPITIEEIKAEPQEQEKPEQPEEPIKETPAVAPIVAPIVVEEQPKEEPPKVEEVPEKVEPKPEVVEQPKEEPKQEIVEEPQEKVYDFILNTNTNKYHDPHCRSVNRMSEKNKEYFTGTVSEVKSRGFEPCEICQ